MSIGLRCFQPARRSHIGLTASSCSYGREFASRFFQLGLAACASQHALRFATVTLIGSGWLLSSNKILPMLGTLEQAFPPALEQANGLFHNAFHEPYRGGSGAAVDPPNPAYAAIVPAGANGAITVLAANPTDLIININGYFAP